MDDDFNTPQALAVLFDLAHELNQALAAEKPLAASALRLGRETLTELAGTVLGLPLESGGAEGSAEREGELVDLLVALRAEVRAQKLWPLSDRIRDGLARLGITLEDKREGTVWKRTS
jgi:cysteinyl-tRNA synthetase